jgi:2',3'-cyclic-nucleotide 2'-phosphodiesterase (5'-nucleotidase family)
MMMRTLRAALALAALALLAGAPAAAADGRGHGFKLTILHNNDGESRLLDAGPGLEQFGGVARFESVMDRLQDEALRGERRRGDDDDDDDDRRAGGLVTLSSGDNFLAGPVLNASLAKGVPFYDSIALRKVEYDALTLGNHDFDFGPNVLADFITGFGRRSPEFLSANLTFDGEPALAELEDDGVIAPSIVVKTRGERVGVVGATTPLLAAISSPGNVGIDPDVAARVQEQVDRLTRRGVDKIIVSSHLQDVNEDRALATMLEDVDVMIAGGGDEILANPGDLLVPGDDPQAPYPILATDAEGRSVPVVTTGGHYKYVGRLVARFDRRGRVVEIGDESGPVRVSGTAPDAVAPDRDIQRQVIEPIQAFIAELANTVIGQTDVILDGERSELRTRETNLGALMADALLWEGQRQAPAFGVDTPQVALQNAGGIRLEGDLPGGTNPTLPAPITELNTLQIASFANFVSVVEDITPAKLEQLMEHGVAALPAANGRFPQVAGMSVKIDPAAPAGNRVLSITLSDGTKIVEAGALVPGAPTVDMATIDFLPRQNGDEYPFGGLPFTTLGRTYQQALSAYIQEGLGGNVTAAQYPRTGLNRVSP